VDNQLKVDRINRAKHGEKKKVKICVNLVNPVQKAFSFFPSSSLLYKQISSIIEHRGYDSSEAATS